MKGRYQLATWIGIALIFLASLHYLHSNSGMSYSEYIAWMDKNFPRSSSSNSSRLSSTANSAAPLPSSPLQASSEMFNRIFKKWTTSYRKCLMDELTNKKLTYWSHMHSAIEKCRGEAMWNLLQVHSLWNSDDVKFVILPERSDDPCTEVTLGIGKDIGSEQRLRQLVPNCTFYGADPIYESGQVFTELGTYFELAVAAESGILEASVLENGRYHGKNVSAVTLIEFLRNHARIDKVDYLFMDNEGPEYRLLWQFLHGGILEKAAISVCQLSVEMHGPFASYGVDASTYENLVLALSTNSSFVPLWSSPPQNHVRSYYLNVEDEYCVRKFLEPRFCSAETV